jgi:hypothetical protein
MSRILRNYGRKNFIGIEQRLFDHYIGFVLVLIDIEKIPSNGREITGTY